MLFPRTDLLQYRLFRAISPLLAALVVLQRGWRTLAHERHTFNSSWKLTRLRFMSDQTRAEHR